MRHRAETLRVTALWMANGSLRRWSEGAGGAAPDVCISHVTDFGMGLTALAAGKGGSLRVAGLSNALEEGGGAGCSSAGRRFEIASFIRRTGRYFGAACALLEPARWAHWLRRS